jgi:hypothetical protein
LKLLKGLLQIGGLFLNSSSFKCYQDLQLHFYWTDTREQLRYQMADKQFRKYFKSFNRLKWV